MRFAEVDYLWFLALLPLLALAGVWAVRRRMGALRRFAGGQAQAQQLRAEVSPNRRAIKRLLITLGLALLALALARPQWGTRLEEVERRGADVVIVVDHSLSMAAQDVAPDRLGLAKHHIRQLSDELAGDRMALVAFAGTSALSCPLTVDEAAVRLFLDTIDVEAAPVQGTSMAEALRAALDAFGPRSPTTPTDRSRAIVLLTDGEDHEGGLEDLVPTLKEQAVAVYALGVGTRRGAPIPVGAGFKKDAEDRIVTTRLDEALLESLAQETQGQYHRASVRGDELDRVVAGIRALDQTEFEATLRARYEERFQWPLGLGLLLLLAECLIGERRRQHNALGTRPEGEAR